MKQMQQNIAVLAVILVAGSAARSSQPDNAAREIIAAERAALDLWGKGQPEGYLALYSGDVTYFDPLQAKRIDGRKAVEEMLTPLRGKVRIDRYEMIDPKVQRYGEVAVLSYRIVSYQKGAGGTELAVSTWNSTQVFRRVGRAWKTVHVHWGFTQPELKRASGP